MMKKEYTTPSMEVLKLNDEDVIRTSNELEPMPIDNTFQ